jgi:hypothetical protein
VRFWFVSFLRSKGYLCKLSASSFCKNKSHTCSSVDILMTAVLFWLFIHQIYSIKTELNFLQYSVIAVFLKKFSLCADTSKNGCSLHTTTITMLNLWFSSETRNNLHTLRSYQNLKSYSGSCGTILSTSTTES